MRPRFGSLIANVWGRSFLRHCSRELRGKVTDPKRLTAAIAGRAQQVFDDGAASLPNHKARMILAMCSSVLAAFQELRLVVGDETAFDLVRRIFEKTFARPLRLQFKLWLWFTRDPVGFLSRHSMAKAASRRYGASMEFDEEQGPDHVDLIVRRCAFHQFFVDHGAPELTPLICAWDRNWMDLLDESSRPVRTERPSTLSTGGDCCRFRFLRTDTKPAAEPQDVILVQLEKRSTTQHKK